MRLNPGYRGRIIAPTFGDAVEACIEGPSGLLAIDPEITWLPSAPGGAKVTWPNGSEALVFGTPAPRDVDRFRAGGNRHIDWWEEMAANPQLRRAWDQAALGLRMGDHPHSIASTTPRGAKDYRELRVMPGVAMTHATLFDNPHNPDEWVQRMRARYEGTRIGRQELLGELLEDVEGALWNRAMLDARVDDPPDLVRVVVAIDPAVTSGESADDTGLIVAGLGADGHGYVLADLTCHVSPEQWARRAVQAYKDFNADRVVAEVNNGGDLVQTVLKTQDDRLPFAKLHASRGKRTRAEPVAALYEQGKVHHVGGFADLEDQLCSWVPGEGDSPDRLDACLVAGTRVETERGSIPIEQVRVGDLAWTRVGWRRVLRAEQTAERTPVRTVVTRAGRRLRGTGNHPIWVAGLGWRPLDALVCGDRLLCVKTTETQSTLNSTERPTRAGRTRPTNTCVGTSRRASSTESQAARSSYTAKCGRRLMGRFRRAISSTTSTETRSTTISRIWHASPFRSMARFTATTPAAWSNFRRLLRLVVGTHQNGIGQRRVAGGTSSTLGAPGKTGGRSSSFAPSAEGRPYDISRLAPGCVSALGAVLGGQLIENAGTNTRCHARRAAHRSGRASIARSQRLAHDAVAGSFASGEAPVYNLQVEGQPEYFADGVLVHNCVWALTELMLKGGPGSLSVPQGQIPRTDPSRRQQLRGQGVPDFMRRSLERGR